MKGTEPTVLIVDDEVQIRRLLRLTLSSNGYKVLEAATGKDGLVEAATRRPDIVLLDLGLPDVDGTTVLKQLREWSKVPVIVLTVRDNDQEKVTALDAGADDYVTKPFSTPELLARVRVALRHAQPRNEERNFVCGKLEVDFAAREVRKGGKVVGLSPTEYALLRLLVTHAGRVLTHTQIMREIWGPNSVGQTHYLRVYVKHLREKLEDDPSRPVLLLTEAGVGYRVKAEDS